ncbi:protein kinase [Spongiactinospora sp. TRM90649]|uniref:protein kinase domain-containing protein n=1 Tax=Spongiactinospora sp. TRM90649 TaxID=3031114 RepID=UPI0023F97DAF|nr:protein kinase [Spongiactinospora sp. TRM90649]MDF5756876.1 protein kinase [Spongiactinospora sp. TRM90649]
MSDSQERGLLVGGRYRLLEAIGRGGMGTVWRAHDEVLGRDIAIKEITPPPDMVGQEREEFLQRTFREARAAGRVSHPGVAAVYDVLEERGHPWIVMELVESKTLGAAIRERGALPVSEVAEIGTQVIAALRAAHQAGVLHRDVKPDNVLLTPDGRAVLTDFGIATMEDDSPMTRTGILVGTPAFIAPERAAGGGAVRASDMWSLGVTLYLAVEGRSPFHRGHPLATLGAVMHDEPAPVSRAGALAPLIAALLRKDPGTRPSPDETAGVLQAVADGVAPEPTATIPVAGVVPVTGVASRPAVQGAGCGHARPANTRTTRPVHTTGRPRDPRTSRSGHGYHGRSGNTDPGRPHPPVVPPPEPVPAPASGERRPTGRKAMAVGGLTGLAVVVAMVSGGAAWLSAQPDPQRRPPAHGSVTTTTTVRSTVPKTPDPQVSVQAPAPSPTERGETEPQETGPEETGPAPTDEPTERPQDDKTGDKTPKKSPSPDDSGKKQEKTPSPEESEPQDDGDGEVGGPDQRNEGQDDPYDADSYDPEDGQLSPRTSSTA